MDKTSQTTFSKKTDGYQTGSAHTRPLIEFNLFFIVGLFRYLINYLIMCINGVWSIHRRLPGTFSTKCIW